VTAAGSARRPGDRLGIAGAAALIASVLLVWLDLGDHALYSPDEGRYALASASMLDRGDWAAPEYRGRAHLTKPPLAYWLQAASMSLFGRSEWALRAPSALASSLTVLVVFAAGRASLGARGGVIAAALTALAPLSFVMGRLATTDSLLNLWWQGALLGGLLAVRSGRRRWAALMWTAAALGLLTKGPVALTPVGVTLAWALLARARGAVRRLGLWWGLPAAMAPLAGWVVAVWRTHPEAFEIWRHEILDRAAGTGDHTEPIWFYLPVLLVGAFPAVAALWSPAMWRLGRWRDGLARAAPTALWALAVAGPFVMFSLIGGKLPSYMLPLVGPMALIASATLTRGLDSSRPPAALVAQTVIMAIVAAGAIAATALRAERFILDAAALALVPIAGAAAWLVWRRAPRRPVALVGVLAAWLAVYVAGTDAEDRLRPRTDPRVLLRVIEDAAERAGVPEERIAFFAFYEPSVVFYAGREIPVVADADGIASLESRLGGPVALIADRRTWEGWFRETAPLTAQRFRVIAEGRRWVSRDVVILTDTPEEQDDAG